MLFLWFLFEVVADWCRTIFLDLLGRRVEEFLGELFGRKQRRKRKSKRRRAVRLNKST